MSTVNHNLNNKPVGFFDSGVGGLSVYSRFKKLLPAENTLYFGDLVHLPYGSKSGEELVGFAREILNFYKEKEVKAVVIACNTSSAKAYDIVKDEYDFKIYPIIQSCAKVIAAQNNLRIGVFATMATVNSKVYTRELMKYNPVLQVKEIACPNWVEIVESGMYKDRSAVNDIKRHVDEMLEFKPEKIILGCTHYPYLIPILKTLAPEDIFIDPAEIFVKYIKEDMKTLGLLRNETTKPYEEIYVSANPQSFKDHSKIFYEINDLPVLTQLSTKRKSLV